MSANKKIFLKKQIFLALSYIEKAMIIISKVFKIMLSIF